LTEPTIEVTHHGRKAKTAKIAITRKSGRSSGMTVRAAIDQGGSWIPYNVLALRDKKLINDQTILEPRTRSAWST
jgi:hypothetical protein